jgi:nitroreductase
MNNKILAINQLIKERRSVKPELFSGQIINDEIINQLLENAHWAPTHGLTEPWRFTVFTGGGLQKLSHFQSNWYKENTLPDKFLQAKFDKLAQNPLNCSHVISLGVSLQNKNNIPEIEEIEALACAVQNMHLTATAYGIGCLWGSGGITYQKTANHFFGLEEKDMLLGFLYLGYPKGDWPIGKRSEYKNNVRWEK